MKYKDLYKTLVARTVLLTLGGCSTMVTIQSEPPVAGMRYEFGS